MFWRYVTRSLYAVYPLLKDSISSRYQSYQPLLFNIKLSFPQHRCNFVTKTLPSRITPLIFPSFAACISVTLAEYALHSIFQHCIYKFCSIPCRLLQFSFPEHRHQPNKPRPSYSGCFCQGSNSLIGLKFQYFSSTKLHIFQYCSQAGIIIRHLLK